MKDTPKVYAREEQHSLLTAFLSNEVETAPNALILNGPASTGKSITLKETLKGLSVRHSWIQCDECVSYKILWKKIIRGIQVDSGRLKKEELNSESLMSTFQSFVKQLQIFMDDAEYTQLHYVILDRADQIMEDGDEIFTNFLKIQEVTALKNLSFIFITNTVPRFITTNSLPSIYFPQYNTDQLIRILSKKPLCHFSENVMCDQPVERDFWQRYVKLIVEAYSTYTTNLSLMKNILIKLWPRFVNPVEDGELRISDFVSLYRRNLTLIGSEFAITSSLSDDSTEVQASSNLPRLTKFLLVASYLASFNDSKHDWPFFGKLKDHHRKKTIKRPSRAVKISSRLLEASSFDLERMFAILQAIYSSESGMKLQSDVDLLTQVANLSSMRLLVKSNNVDYISAKTKWKINCSFEFVKSLADELCFDMVKYLAD